MEGSCRDVKVCRAVLSCLYTVSFIILLPEIKAYPVSTEAPDVYQIDRVRGVRTGTDDAHTIARPWAIDLPCVISYRDMVSHIILARVCDTKLND